METVIKDLRFGVRSLLKRPGFAAVTVLTLALSIGANTAIFSVINSVLLRPLPYTDPDRLVQVKDSLPTIGFPRAELSEVEFIRLRSENKSFAQVGAYQSGALTLTGVGDPERVPLTAVSDNFVTLLGASPQLGRAFLPGEDEQSRSNVVMLSHDFWKRRFGGDPNVLNQRVILGGNAVTIIGVLRPDFQSPADLENRARAEILMPLGLNLASLNLGSHGMNTIGRLQDGVTSSQAASETNLIIGRVVSENPTYYPADGSFRSYLIPLHEGLVGDVRPALLVLLGAVGFVLLIACANVANLLLARAETRQQEISIRAALGASRSRIIRQLLSESLILAVSGGLAGLILVGGAVALTRVLTTLLFQVSPTDPMTFALVAFVLAVVALFACYIPARRAMKVDPLVALRYE